MKIGIVCYPTYGGSGIVATELGMDLAERGHQVHFISTSLPARLNVTMPNIFFHKVNVETYPLFEFQPYSLALSTLIVNVTQTYGLDLIHVHYAIPHAYAAYFAKQILKDNGINLPVITTLHGTDITLVGVHPAYKPAVEFSINKSDKVTAVSESLKKETFEFFNITTDIQVITNFIDNTQFHFDCEDCDCRTPNGENEEKVIIHVSNLRKVKRIDDVISVFYEIQKEVKSRLIIVGEGPEWENVSEQINRLGIHDKVKNLGKVNDLYKVLCSADLFLLPSEKESFGLAALEAMAAKVPVISSNAGGIPEVNIDGETGFVRPIGDVKGMAEKAILLLQNPEMLKNFRENAKERALFFDKKRILPQYEQLYYSVLAEVRNNV